MAEKTYWFKFNFSEKYRDGYKSYFNQQMTITIWNEMDYNLAFPARFENVKNVREQVIGEMTVLMNETICLRDLNSKLFYLNTKDDIVGEIILLDEDFSLSEH
ncbi:hypothetical protein [Gilvibacter sp.]|uniref:hypothetical protein n=1 Tax=Gilvibacter sp. TaxID=2729997 RepID=UPI003F4A6E61